MANAPKANRASTCGLADLEFVTRENLNRENGRLQISSISIPPWRTFPDVSALFVVCRTPLLDEASLSCSDSNLKNWTAMS